MGIDDISIAATAPTTPTDTTPPAFATGSPSAGSITATSFVLSSTINEVGKTYFVVLPDNAKAPTSAQVKNGNDGNDQPALADSFTNPTANTAATYTVGSLTANTNYDVYVVAEDAATPPNLQAAPVKLDLLTLPTPTLSVNPTGLNPFSATTGSPSGAQSYIVQGTNVTADVTITAPTGYAVSLNNGTYSNSVSVTAANANGTGQTIYVRLTGATAGSFSGNVTNTSGTASANVAVNGTTTDPPALAVAPNSRSGFTYGLNAGPSAPQTFTLSGSNLSGSAIGLTAPTGYELSKDNTTNSYGTTLSYTYSAGTLANQTVYVRLQAGLGVGSYGGDVSISGGGATASVTVSGSVTAPAIATGGITGSPFCVGQGAAGAVSVSVPFTVSGGAFAASNLFTAYLSNDNFVSNSLPIGTLSGTGSGTIAATISQTAGLTTGSAYRIRVEASSPASSLANNGSNLTVASYLDNEVALATTTPGNTQATLSFTGPAACATNVVVTLKAGSSAGTKPLAGNSYVPGAGTGSVAFGTGTDLGGGQYVVYNGPATGSITVTGLTNGTQYTFGAFTTNGGNTGTTGYSDGVTRTVRPTLIGTVTDVVVPQFLSARNSTSSHSLRLPYVWRITLTNLLPNTTYKYYTAARAAADPATYVGAGVPLETKTAGAFVRQSGPGLTATSSTLLTDATGSYSGWFGLEPTADDRFADQATLYPMVVLNDGDGTNTATQFLPTTASVKALSLSTNARGVRGNSFGTASNFVLIYDNVAGTGRPLAGTWLESDGTSQTGSNYPGFYSPIDAVAGGYVLLTPNANASGIRRVEQRALADGSLLNCAATDADGTWPGGANTVNPSSNTTPLILTTGDTPFAAPTLTALSATTIQPGQTITLTGTNFPAAPKATVTFAPGGVVTAATVASSTSLTVVVPAGAGTGTIAVSNTCGSSNTLATQAVPPPGPGLLLVEDDFDYAAGQALTDHGWEGSTNSAPVTTAGNVTLSGYPQGAALGATPATTSTRAALAPSSLGTPMYRTFAPPTGTTTIYVAALLNVTTVRNASSDEYFLSFRTTSGGTAFRGRVTISRSTTTTFNFALRPNGNDAAITDLTTFSTNTPYLVVLKLENSLSTSNNDKFSLYVLPAGSDLSTEPTAPLYTVTSGNNFSTSNSFQLRQQDTNNPTYTLDGLRIATGWGTAVGNPVYTAANSPGSPTVAAGNYYSLTLNNGGTLTPAGAINVENLLTLTSGALNTSATNSLTLYPAATVAPAPASNPGYVNGPVQRPVAANTANQSFTFPVGRSGNYRPLTLNVTGQPNGPATYTATQNEGDAGQNLSAGNGLGSAPLLRVSQVRSYGVTTSNSGSGFSGTITLSFEPNDYVNNPADAGLVVAKRDAAAADPADNNKWTNLGHSTESGTGTGAGGAPVSGTLTSALFNSFSDFTLGATNASNPLAAVNPLPVVLVGFGATRAADKAVALTWTTASELNSAYFDVERSLDGRAFEFVARVRALGQSAQAHTYATRDEAAPAARLYYRLHLVDQDGKAGYSPVVTVAPGAAGELTLWPNPARESLSLLTAEALPYVLRNALGQPVRTGTTAAGTATTLGLEGLAGGVYFVELRGPAGSVVRKFVKE